ncbi:MAG: SagB/ThcOx family dehydrogenase [Clostridiaceae bacterium]|jgi:SagB-type dehydrogenase family enzyme|nr:SagB/ThcOx family dehydrogenase [Clostridiaceae bacterium]
MKKRLSGYDSNKRYFWSPAFDCVNDDDHLRIGAFDFGGDAGGIFPELYYITQRGATPCEMMQRFTSVDPGKLEKLIKELVQKRVLVSSILSPSEIFEVQSRMFKNEYDEETFLNPARLEEYRRKQLNRRPNLNETGKILLEQKEAYPELISQRRTYRTFDTDHRISMKTLSQLMSVFRQVCSEGEIRYYYASAGGLYPVDIYVYAKDNRVESVQGGLYYYSPIDNSLVLANSSCVITEAAHLFTNKDIFRSSALSLFFIYNADVSMPKYGGMAYFYACIDTGLMVGALTAVAELNDIGICSVGSMEFDRIKKYFHLNENQTLLHTVEAGLKPKI